MNSGAAERALGKVIPALGRAGIIAATKNAAMEPKMSDRFADHAASLVSPAHDGFAITPTDGVDLIEVTRALYVGVGGDLGVVLAGGAELMFSNVAAGSFLPLRVAQVKATGTNAGAIVGLV